jgi:hypothetical protein
MNKEQQKTFLRTVGQFIARTFEPRIKALEDREITFEYDGERSFTVKCGDSVSEFVLPVIIDRGVHSTDEKYARGDAVSSGGSLWIAQKNEPDHKPGEGDGWRLAVKRGRDAA